MDGSSVASKELTVGSSRQNINFHRRLEKAVVHNPTKWYRDNIRKIIQPSEAVRNHFKHGDLPDPLEELLESIDLGWPLFVLLVAISSSFSKLVSTNLFLSPRLLSKLPILS